MEYQFICRVNGVGSGPYTFRKPFQSKYFSEEKVILIGGL